MNAQKTISPTLIRQHFICNFLEHQARTKPKDTAVRFENQYLTYRALNNSANQLAHYLRDIGVQTGELIAISVERSVEMLIGILGIMRAGGVYVPIDPSYPNERIQYILKDTEASILLTQKHLAEKFTHVKQTICFETDWLNILNYSTQAPFIKQSEEDLAYIIYTSGSTGKPKGVMVSHENLWYSTTARLKYYPDKIKNFLLLSSFAFDSSVAGIFWTLADGGTLVLPPQGAEKDPQHLVNLIAEHQISHLLCLPSLHGLLLEHPVEKLNSLQTVIVAGEASSKSLVSRHYERLTNTQLYNEYGPTEGSVWATVFHCTPTIQAPSVPIGKGISHASIFILDEQQKGVGVGKQGEIYIGGKGLTQGYLHQAGLTAQKFLEIPHPTLPSMTVKAYRTGDLGAWLPCGNIEFLGRSDHQIKLRGYRIELGEIEEALHQLPAVKEAIVVVKGKSANSKKLVAYLVLQQKDQLTEQQVKEQLSAQLPDYMIPSNVVLLEEMPLTPNGKIDRKALTNLQLNRPKAHKTKSQLPDSNNVLEHFIQQLWREVLELEEVELNEKFFELGGNSLQAAQFINRMQQELKESIFIVTIFEHPTVESYAAMLKRDYAEALAKHPIFGNQKQASISKTIPTLSSSFQKLEVKKLQQNDFEHFHQYVPNPVHLDLKNSNVTVSQKPIIFILAPPRSGTTLLRVMLAGHPQIFAANELQLLGFKTMRDRSEAYSGKFGLWKEGLVRTVMELQGCDADTAKFSIFQCEQQGRNVLEMYHLLQHWLEDQILVDKSPSYAMHPQILEQANTYFPENAIFIHLVRHPYAMIQSFDKMNMHQVAYLQSHPYNGQEIGELTWTHSHQNIHQFLQRIPENRQYRLHFEELVKNPLQQMQAMCKKMGISFHKDMVNPYQNIESKMITGIYKDSKAMGDPKLLQQRAINPKLAESWKGVLQDDFLADVTWELYSCF